MATSEQRLLQLAGEAISLASSERERFLRALGGEDRDLVEPLRDLLREHASGDCILDDRDALMAVLREGGRSRPMPRLLSGTVLVERFEIERSLGVGGMGVTYAAWDRELEARVALKVLTSTLDDPTAEPRFRREIHLARQVTHPNVCRVFDLFRHRDEEIGVTFLTMELISGSTLSQYLDSRPRLTPSEALPIARQIAAALDAAHGVGIVHRDLKPSNIMVEESTAGLRVVVTDFGLASWCEPERRAAGFVTKTGQIAGTPAYMSPEQLKNEPVTPSSDIYGFALVLYRMITGKVPFDASSPLSMAVRRLHEPPPSPKEDLPDLDEGWERALVKALARDPEQRFSSAGALVAALEEEPAPRRPRAAAFTVAALVVLVAGGAALLMQRETRSVGAGPRSAAAESAVANHQWVLMTAFDNRTGDSLLEGTLEVAMARELERDHTISIVPRERVLDTLRLMRRPEDTTVDRIIGREVAVRDGAIANVIDGKILQLGSTLLVSIDLLDPDSGDVVATWDAEARALDDVLPLIRRISSEVRGKLHPGGISQEDAPLAQVTTSSLRALQLYTQADRIVNTSQAVEAEELLRQAVAEDSEFASGFIHLAYAIKNRGGAPEEYLPFVDRAVELSGKATERERLFIRASAFRLRGEFDRAKQVYLAMLSRYPEHPWALNNMVNLLTSYTPAWAEAAPYAERKARLRANDPVANFAAAIILAVHSEEPEKAEEFFRKSRRLLRPGDELYPSQHWYELHRLWMEERLAELEDGVARVMKEAESSTGLMRGFGAEGAARFHLTLGKLDEAAKVYAMLPESRRKPGLLLVAGLRGDHQEALDLLEELSQAPAVTPALIAQAVRLGELDAAKKLHAREVENLDRLHFDDRLIHEAALEASGAIVAARTEDPEHAIPELKRAMERFRPTGRGLYFQVASELARLLAENGDAAEAVRVLEEASMQRRRAIVGVGRISWLEIRLQLGDLHRAEGNEQTALAIEAELDRLTELADPDFTIRRSLDERRRS